METATKKELSAKREILLVGSMAASRTHITASAPRIPFRAISFVSREFLFIDLLPAW
jgi:hypothetical protein